MKRTTAGPPASPSALQDLSYSYDAGGNVLSIADANAGGLQTQRFGYDALDRLIWASAAGGRGGTYPQERQQSAYDALGNLVARAEMSLAYQAPQHPHAVTHVGNQETLITLRAKGASAGGSWPRMQLWVNRQLVRTWVVASETYTTYTVRAPLTGKDEVAVVFPNPGSAGPEVRTLWVDWLQVGAAQLQAESASVTYDPGNPFDGMDAIAGGRESLTELSGLRVVAGTAAAQFTYDANGNMTERPVGTDTLQLSYDVENRLSEVRRNGALLAEYSYDAEGQRVKSVTYGPTPGERTTTLSIGNYLEWESRTCASGCGGLTPTTRRYYYAGTERIAMSEDGVLSYLLGDHLGSTSLQVDSAGARVAERRYLPWGETRYSEGNLATSYRFTGQRLDQVTGLYYYGARYYDPTLGRFIQPDTIVPDPGNPQAFNRYAYALNNPVKYTDPTGHSSQAVGQQEKDEPSCLTNECWEARWYLSHGYRFFGHKWHFTNEYYFMDASAARDLMAEVRGGQHTIQEGASFSFHVGRALVSLAPRGKDNGLSNALGAIGIAADIIDFGITSGFTGAYLLEQSAMTFGGGPVGAAGGYVVGEGAYRMVQAGVNVVDGVGLLAVFGADVAAGRAGFREGEAAVGVDLLASLTSFGLSNTPTPVIPGVLLSEGGDAAQLTYDYMRLSGRIPGYSLIVQWR